MQRGGIFLGIGANLTLEQYSSPQEACIAALHSLSADGIEVEQISPWYKSAPVPISDQPWYHNAVAEVATSLSPQTLLATLHDCEERFGRVRHERNEARVIDIDVLDYQGMVMDGNINLPHPRMHLRAFVLQPLGDIAPEWRHPISGLGISDLLAEVDESQNCMKL